MGFRWLESTFWVIIAVDYLRSLGRFGNLLSIDQLILDIRKKENGHEQDISFTRNGNTISGLLGGAACHSGDRESSAKYCLRRENQNVSNFPPGIFVDDISISYP